MSWAYMQAVAAMAEAPRQWAQPTAAQSYLQVHGRVPVTLIEDDCVCCCQVDAQTTSTGAQHEHKVGVIALQGETPPHTRAVSQG